MNQDNQRLAFIEGGRFERLEYGDRRNALIAELKMPEGFKLSSRSVFVLEVEDYDALRAQIERLQSEVEAYGLAEAERNAGVVGECPGCVEHRLEGDRLGKNISHAVDLLRDYAASDQRVYGRVAKSVIAALRAGEGE